MKDKIWYNIGRVVDFLWSVPPNISQVSIYLSIYLGTNTLKMSISYGLNLHITAFRQTETKIIFAREKVFFLSSWPFSTSKQLVRSCRFKLEDYSFMALVFFFLTGKSAGCLQQSQSITHTQACTHLHSICSTVPPKTFRSAQSHKQKQACAGAALELCRWFSHYKLNGLNWWSCSSLPFSLSPQSVEANKFFFISHIISRGMQIANTPQVCRRRTLIHTVNTK